MNKDSIMLRCYALNETGVAIKWVAPSTSDFFKFVNILFKTSWPQNFCYAHAF